MIRNLTRASVLSYKTCFACGIFFRGRGMIGRRFDDFDAMVFENCDAIHTMFMSFSIDVIFVNIENRIIHIRESLKPWRPLIWCKGAFFVVEMPEGMIKKTCTELNDCVDLNAELTEDALREFEKRELVRTPETYIPFGEKEE